MESPQTNSYKIIRGLDIDEGRIKQAVEIDERAYSEEFKGISKICLSWFNKNQNIYTFIIDNKSNNVVGYLNAMPLDDTTFNNIQSGSSMDTDINPENILTYDGPGLYKLYLCSFVVDPEYQGTILFKLLFDALFNNLLALSKNGIFITEMIADAVTNAGVKLCEFIGMEKIISTNHGTSIYKTTIYPPTFRLTTKSTKELLQYFQSK